MVEDILENISQRKYRFIFFIIIVIVIICSVYFYQKSQEHFEDEFLKFFKILKSEKILESERTIYIMEKNLKKN